MTDPERPLMAEGGPDRQIEIAATDRAGGTIALRQRGDELLVVSDLVTHFPVRTRLLKRIKGHIHAVDGVSVTVRRGETLALVGESGCGKTTLARTIIGLYRPTSGSILLEGSDITGSSRRARRQRQRDVQLVFQDPYGSLPPRMKVRDIVAEPLVVHGEPRDRIAGRVDQALEMVGLDRSQADRYSHEFSGGQRQRIGIARALILRPKLIILDEPVSALDVSIQAQVLNLLQDLQEELALSYLLISHDLAVVRHIATTVAVMYLGKIVETAPSEELYDRPAHPYTQALLKAVPVPDPRRAGSVDEAPLEGDLPDPMNPPSGCRFRTRCWKADERCAAEEPALVPRAGTAHPSACHYAAADLLRR